MQERLEDSYLANIISILSTHTEPRASCSMCSLVLLWLTGSRYQVSTAFLWVWGRNPWYLHKTCP